MSDKKPRTTTIMLDRNVYDKLRSVKVIPEEPFSSVVDRLLKGYAKQLRLGAGK